MLRDRKLQLYFCNCISLSVSERWVHPSALGCAVTQARKYTKAHEDRFTSWPEAVCLRQNHTFPQSPWDAVPPSNSPICRFQHHMRIYSMILFTWVLDSCLWQIFFFRCGQWNYKAWKFQFWLFPSNVPRTWMRALRLQWGCILSQNLIHCNPKSKCVSQTTRLPRIPVFMTKLSGLNTNFPT